MVQKRTNRQTGIITRVNAANTNKHNSSIARKFNHLMLIVECKFGYFRWAKHTLNPNWITTFLFYLLSSLSLLLTCIFKVVLARFVQNVVSEEEMRRKPIDASIALNQCICEFIEFFCHWSVVWLVGRERENKVCLRPKHTNTYNHFTWFPMVFVLAAFNCVK